MTTAETCAGGVQCSRMRSKRSLMFYLVLLISKYCMLKTKTEM